MGSYEDSNDFFDYTNKKEWIEYIKNSIIPLWEYSYILKQFFEELKSEFNGRTFSEISKEYRALFLGGFIPSEEEFSSNSLAKFYLNFFGLDMNRNLWKLQEELSEKVGEIDIFVNETDFIKFIKGVYSLLGDGLDLQGLVKVNNTPVRNYEELIKDPNKLKDIVSNFYQRILDISINYNPKTFFLCSIKQITQKYIKSVYPRFSQIHDVMCDEFGLIELVWENPINPETKIFQDYTIFCFPEFNTKDKNKSFGGSICILNNLILERFSESSNLQKILGILFFNVPILKENYMNNIRELPEAYYDTIYYEGISASDNHNNVHESKTSLMKMIDENSPFLFVNKIYIKDIDIRYGKNEISFSEI